MNGKQNCPLFWREMLSLSSKVIHLTNILEKRVWGPKGGQSVKQNLGFCSGHDLTVCEFKPQVRPCTGSMEPVWDSLPPSLPSPALSLSLQIKK